MSELHVAVEANVVGVMSNTTAADIPSSVRMPSLPPAILPPAASFIFTMKKEGRKESVCLCVSLSAQSKPGGYFWQKLGTSII